MICPECDSLHTYETEAEVGDARQVVIICNDCGYAETDPAVIAASKLTTKQLSDIANSMEK